jgi:diguanylate cyclase (GGDEF)-like protein
MDAMRILLVDDNPGMIQVMARILSCVAQLQFATSGAAALQQARDTPPDLILLDAEMPGLNGYEVCEALKADPHLADIPVIFVTGHGEQAFELKGLEIGAVDFLTKPISEPLLLARVKTQLRVKHLTDELKRISTVDALTETLNRRAFDTALSREWKRGLRAGEPICMLMVDVDHFKLFNDNYGHPAGDACLRAVAQALKRAVLRPADIVARYGGEEFALLLPQTPRAGAQHLVKRLLDAVQAVKIPHAASPTASHLSVSIGIGCYDMESRGWLGPSAELRDTSDITYTPAGLVDSSDKALYAAKRAGRAQAWLLDIADVDAPQLARAITPVALPAPKRVTV